MPVDCLMKPEGYGVLGHLLLIPTCHKEEPTMICGSKGLGPFEVESDCPDRAEYHLLWVVTSEVP